VPSSDEPEYVGDDAPATDLAVATSASPDPQRPDAFLVPLEDFAEAFRRGALKRQPRKARVYPKPFVIDQSDLDAIDRRIRHQLDQLNHEDVLLEIEVGYADLSSETFQDWQTCVAEAAERADAERLKASWQTIVDRSSVSEVLFELVTDQPLVVARQLGPIPDAANVTVTVSSQVRPWITATLDSLQPLIESTRLPRLYRPLETLRSGVARTIGGLSLGLVAFFVTLRILTNLISNPTNSTHLHTILAKHDLSARFEAFVRQFYGPQQGFIASLLVFFVPYGLLLVGQIYGARLLAHLVPRSFIVIGLSRKRYKDYENLFRFLVFGVLVTLIIGVAASAVYGALS
jgi:hypothetical protein